MADMATIELQDSYIGDVKIFGGAHEEGELLQKCRIVINGNIAKLMHWQPTDNRFRSVDRLTDVEAVETATGLTFSGRSAHLLEEVGVTEEDAMVSWAFVSKACRECH